jgi:L-cysteine:1D-myo-inositol 2-amino-2-deoxy-alpha-D-glucopyranoside ligase
MPAASERLTRWRGGDGPDDAGLVDLVRAAVDDDLDTPAALAAVDAAAAAGRSVASAAALLGVRL